MRCRLSLLASLSLLALLGCGGPETLDAGDELPLCSNGPGPVVNASEDKGDWEPGAPFASCRSLAEGACGEEDSFSYDGCDRKSLGRLLTDGQLDGEFTMQVRYEALGEVTAQCNAYNSDAFLLTSGGGGFVASLPVSRSNVGERALFAQGEGTLGGSLVRSAIAGCEAKSADEVVGCYQECRDGALVGRGTFRALRAGPRAGEPESRGLQLLSASATARPASLPAGLPFVAADVWVTKGHAYVSVIHGGLFVFDVRNPQQPVLRQHLYVSNDNYYNAVWGKGDALYVASGTRGVNVYDLRDPASPTFVVSLPGDGSNRGRNVHTLHVDGNLLYAAANLNGNVVIYDVTNPLAPVQRGLYRPPDFDAQRFYGPHDMRGFEGRLYVNAWAYGLHVADVANPAAPVQLGRYTYPRATSHASALGRFGNRIIAFEGGEQWGAHLRVLDVTNPANIRLVGEYRFAEHVSIHNLELVGTKLYVAHYQGGLRVLDVSVPETPHEVGHFNNFRPGDPNRGESFYDGAIGVRVPGDGYVYVADTSRGLLILQEQ